MKKLSFYLAALLFLAAPFVFVACDDDEGDQTAPSVEVSSPAANARILAGETVQVNAVVEDETGLAEITVALTAAGGNFPLLTLGPNDFTSPTRHVVDQAITVPATVPPGQYAVAITARDLAGNTSSPLQVNVRVNSCSVPGLARYRSHSTCHPLHRQIPKFLWLVHLTVGTLQTMRMS